MFKNLSSNFSKITNRIFGWTIHTDPAITAQQMMANYEIEHSVNNLLLTKFFDIRETKKELIEDIDNIKDFYFSQLIVDRIIDDALNPAGNNHKLFEVRVRGTNGKIDESASKLANDFVEEFNVQKIIVDIASDLLFYGEYAIRVEVNGLNDEGTKKGIINIHDDVDISSLVPVFRDSDVSYFLKVGKNKIETVQPTSLIYFSLPSSRIRVKMEGLDDKILYLRMGKSILYPVYGLLKELKFLENLVPISFINNAIKTKLVSVSVPSSTKPAEAKKIAQTFQRMINNTLRIDSTKKSEEELLKAISSKVGEVKVIPNFGDKGELQAEDFSSDTDFDEMNNKILDLRKMILTTIGIPASIIDEESLKSDVIKDHIRYSKKLKSVQFALKEGIQRMILVHLINNGFHNFLKEDIEITFLNILNVDDLEKLEYIDLTVSMLDNYKSFISDFENHDEIGVNYEEYVRFMNKQFDAISGFDIFYHKTEKDDEI